MLRQTHRKSLTSNGILFYIIMACSLGSLLGFVSGVFSGLVVLEVVTAFIIVYASIKRPEIALLGILIATSSIVFEDQLPIFTAGGISLHITDFLLIGMLGLIVVRWLGEPEFKVVRTPLDWPLLIFFGVTLLSTFISLFYSLVDVEEARRGIRILAYFLTFFIVTNLVRDRRQLSLLLNGLFSLATLVALAMVAQYLLGSSVALIPGRVETLDTQGIAYADVTRILPPGISIVLVAFVTIFCILLLGKSRLLLYLQAGLLGMAVLFSFLRSYWGALIVVVVLLGFILRRRDRYKLVGWSIVVALLAAILLLSVAIIPGSKVGGLLSASSDRISTIFNVQTYQGQDGSFNWRVIENEYAYSAIAENPWLGTGIGFIYRPWDRKLDAPGNYYFRNHIHNGHLLILLQSGLIGYLSFLGLSIAFLVRGFRSWRNVSSDQMKGVVLGFTLVYLAILIAAWVNGTFGAWQWTPVIGIILGVNEVVFSLYDQNQHDQV